MKTAGKVSGDGVGGLGRKERSVNAKGKDPILE